MLCMHASMNCLPTSGHPQRTIPCLSAYIIFGLGRTHWTLISSLNHLETSPCTLNNSTLFCSSPPANEFRMRWVAAFLSPNTHEPDFFSSVLAGNGSAGYGRGSIGGARRYCSARWVLGIAGLVGGLRYDAISKTASSDDIRSHTVT